MDGRWRLALDAHHLFPASALVAFLPYDYILVLQALICSSAHLHCILLLVSHNPTRHLGFRFHSTSFLCLAAHLLFALLLPFRPLSLYLSGLSHSG